MLTPSLLLDFTAASLDSRITFARALNTATRVNSSGFIESVNADVARFDYDPVSLACRGLLVEEARTNYILQSSNLGTTWANSQTVLSLDAVVSPDGTQNADKAAANTTAGVEHYVEQTVAITTNQSYTATFYAKEAGKTGNFDVVIVAVGSPTTLSTARFSITSGVIAYTNVRNGIVTSASSVAVGNGWYRLTINYTLSGTVTSHRLRIYPSSQQGTFTGDGTSGIYIWGAQIEAGAFHTSYIPTTTTSVTRNADVATITGANFSDWWQAGKGGVLVRARPGTVSGTRPWVQFDDNTADNIIALRGNITNPELYIVDGGTPQAQIDAGTIAANTDYSLTGWWQTNDCRAKLGSGAQVIDNTATIPTVTQARIGSDGTNYLNGHIASISYYDSFTSQIYNRRKNKAIFSLM